jgi:hypothetical protein
MLEHASWLTPARPGIFNSAALAWSTPPYPVILASAGRCTLPAAPSPPYSGEALVEYKLELVLLPVADVDRAKAFYTTGCGFHLDSFAHFSLATPTAIPGCFRKFTALRASKHKAQSVKQPGSNGTGDIA